MLARTVDVDLFGPDGAAQDKRGAAVRALPLEVPDGDWPSPLADETLAAPVLYLRRILGGFSHRLAITPSFTGGSSPGFVMSLECETRY